jgi:hypothetical protein
MDTKLLNRFFFLFVVGFYFRSTNAQMFISPNSYVYSENVPVYIERT